MNEIYQDESFIIKQSQNYPNCIGAYEIREVQPQKWDNSSNNIKKLANIEWYLRKFLYDKGYELICIYMEIKGEGQTVVQILPYDVKVLENQKIPLELYEKYFKRYFEIMDTSESEEITAFNKELFSYIKRKIDNFKNTK